MRAGQVLAVAAAGALAAATVVPASAVSAASPGAGAGGGAEGAVTVSADGRHWSARLDAPLFERLETWVPGDRQRAVLSVRNGSSDRARGVVDVDVDTVGARPDAARQALGAALRVRTRVDDGPWVQGRRSEPLRVAPGQVVRVGVEVTFDPGAGNDTQGARVPVEVVATLSEAASTGSDAGPPAGPATGSDGAWGGGSDVHSGAHEGLLAHTGIPVGSELGLAVGAVLVGGLVRLLAGRRRERRA